MYYHEGLMTIFLFQKYVKNKKSRIYTAFIDLRKFFDSINRKCLLYKLINCGITGKIYQVIKHAYEMPQFCVKTKYGLTEYFSSTTGVKQGCILSPALSNIFQNDLHECFNKNCDPVILGDIDINSLAWADDLVVYVKIKRRTAKCFGLSEQILSEMGSNC